jgi:hypothetical protein
MCNRQTNTIPYANLILASVFLRGQVQILEIICDMMGGTRIRVPIFLIGQPRR